MAAERFLSVTFLSDETVGDKNHAAGTTTSLPESIARGLGRAVTINGIGATVLHNTASQQASGQALVSGAWKTCPNTLDASVTYETTQLSVAASQTVTLALAGVAALPPGGLSMDVAAGGASATLAFSGGATHEGSSASITLSAGYTYTVRPAPTAGAVYVTGGPRL